MGIPDQYLYNIAYLKTGSSVKILMKRSWLAIYMLSFVFALFLKYHFRTSTTKYTTYIWGCITEKRGFEPLVRLLVRFISNEVLSASQSSLHLQCTKMYTTRQDLNSNMVSPYFFTPCRTRTYDIRFWRPAFYQLN